VCITIYQPDTESNPNVEADRISFSFYFSAPENAFFHFSAFYFSAEKDIRIFVFLFFFSVIKWPLKKQKSSQYFG